MLPSPESEVRSVGVSAGAPARRFTYTLIGSRSGRIGRKSAGLEVSVSRLIHPAIWPPAICSLHETIWMRYGVSNWYVVVSGTVDHGVPTVATFVELS